MDFSIKDIKKAYELIENNIIKTPLIRLYSLDKFLNCEVYVKAENMQLTGAFKLRGAMNKILSLSEEDIKKGIVAASSGNHGKAVAYTAKMLKTKATIVMPDTAPQIKVNAIKALGAEVIQCPAVERFEIAEKICSEKGATMVPPYNDYEIMAGQGTIGIEIVEQCSDLDMVIVPVSGGGLISGVGTAIKSLSSNTKVYGAEPANLPKFTASIKSGEITKVEQKSTIADALVSQAPGIKCYPYAIKNTDGFADVDEEYILKGMKLLLSEGKILAEPSSCIGIGAVLQGLIKVNKNQKVCFLISGGSVGLEQLKILDEVSL